MSRVMISAAAYLLSFLFQSSLLWVLLPGATLWSKEGGTQVNSWFKEPTTPPFATHLLLLQQKQCKMGTGYRGVKDIVFEFREVQWRAPRGAVAFKPVPNPALNKPLEGDSNQKRLLKILHEPAHIHTQSHRHRAKDVGECSGSGCVCVTLSQ